jgi:hypothetical protein
MATLSAVIQLTNAASKEWVLSGPETAKLSESYLTASRGETALEIGQSTIVRALVWRSSSHQNNFFAGVQ